MPQFRTGTVLAVLSERPGLQRVTVDLGDREHHPAGEQAYVLTDLIGPVRPDDEVVLNTTAVDLGLGTGGWHVVHWNLSRREWDQPGRGHIMKLRYTSLQADTGAGEEYQHGDALDEDLRGAPVVACTLHSQVACVAATVAHLAPAARVAYVMTDGAALPVVISDLVSVLRERDVIVGTVTAGHAFGGDIEAVSVPSALVLARQSLRADVIVVGMGPGIIGTGTGLGTTAVDAAAALDAASVLGGGRVLAVRVSDADERERHRGVSHHSLTVLRLCRPGATVALPANEAIQLDAPGHIVERVETPDLEAVFDDLGLRVTTMGRGPDEDPLFFRAAAAAGVIAARQAGL